MLFGDTAMHCRYSAFVGCVCLRQAWFSFWRSTTLLGFPDFLAMTGLGAHHMVGLLTSRGRRMPMLVSLLRLFLVSFSQWTATGLCLSMAKGLPLAWSALHGWMLLPLVAVKG